MEHSEAWVPLTNEQIERIWDIRNTFQDRIGHDAKDPESVLRNQISLYLALMVLGARAEAAKFIDMEKRARRDRAAYLRSIRSRSGEKATADIVLAELNKTVVVPGFVREAIRRDMIRLGG